MPARDELLDERDDLGDILVARGLTCGSLQFNASSRRGSGFQICRELAQGGFVFADAA